MASRILLLLIAITPGSKRRQKWRETEKRDQLRAVSRIFWNSWLFIKYPSMTVEWVCGHYTGYIIRRDWKEDCTGSGDPDPSMSPRWQPAEIAEEDGNAHAAHGALCWTRQIVTYANIIQTIQNGMSQYSPFKRKYQLNESNKTLFYHVTCNVIMMDLYKVNWLLLIFT